MTNTVDPSQVPTAFVVLSQTDWVNLRWQIAIDVLTGFTDQAAAARAITTLRDMDAKMTVEWRVPAP